MAPQLGRLRTVNLWKDRQLRLRLTPLGLQVLVAAALLGLFAVNSGNNLLHLIFSLMLGVFVVSGVASRKAIRNLELLGFDENNLFARVRGGLRLRLRDTAPGRWRGVEVHLELASGRVEPAFLSGGPGPEELRLTLQVTPAHRGFCAVRALELRTRFPFGFLEKSWRYPLEHRLLVNPHPRSAGLVFGASGEVVRRVSRPGTANPEGVRPFRSGDSPGRVHWKRTAQRGEPWVRVFEEDATAGLHLLLDLRQWQPGQAFERELERLSGLVLQARLLKQEVHLELRGEQGLRSHWGCTPCWRALAQAEAEGSTEAIPQPQRGLP